MEIYIVNGDARWYAEGEAPAGAVPYGKKPEKAPVEEKPVEKAIKKPANKAKKAGSSK